ncbi:MAG: T9SS type A sorting domain-containing protein [Bacteroidota bacterium]
MRQLKRWLGLLWLGAWLPLGAQSVAQLEYFIDQDPGAGNGIPIVAPTQDTVIASLNIPTVGLSDGFHSLMVRALDVDGTWSIYAKRSFFVQGGAQSGTPPLSSAAEYFVDQDPGVGNGVPLNIMPGDTSEWSGSIATDGLGDGFHTLFIRAIDADGTWSLYSKRTFYLQDTTKLQRAPLVAWEYYVDQDPGAGSGTRVSLPGPVDTALVLAGIPVGTLSNGMHRVFVRFLDADSTWSMPASRAFEVVDCVVPQPAINVSGSNTLTASMAGDRYLWYLDGNLLVADTRLQSIQAPQSGIYQVRVVVEGCLSPFSEPLPFTVITSLNPLQEADAHIVVYPNPASDKIHVYLAYDQALRGTLQIRDLQGRLIWARTDSLLANEETESIDVSALLPGLYILQCTTEKGTLIRRFVKR